VGDGEGEFGRAQVVAGGDVADGVGELVEIPV